MIKRPKSLCGYAVAVLLLASCADTETGPEHRGETHVVHWGYEADDGPDKWGSMDPDWALCSEGREQSPIDLANGAPIALPGVEIHTPSDQQVEVLNQEGVIDALDNGHTIQINTQGAERMHVGDMTYSLV